MKTFVHHYSLYNLNLLKVLAEQGIRTTFYSGISLFFLLMLTQNCLAQDLSVIASLSSDGESQHYQMSCTVGELIIWTGGTTQIVVTQGFQQPDYKVPVSVPKIDEAHWQLSLSPNPAHSHLDFYYSASPEENLYFQVYDAAGRLIGEPVYLPDTGFYNLSLYNLSVGSYMVHFFDNSGKQTVRQFLLLR